ncbi:MAG: cation-transporting P-type ATPase, partial [Candidatus Bipolaricaulota bacterium]
MADALQVATEEGLGSDDAQRREQRYGSNRLRAVRRERWWWILARQARSFIVVLLAAAGAVSFAFGETLEGLAIVAVLVINTAIGFVTELRAVRSMEALSQLVALRARVRRDGQLISVPVERLVPGDVIVLEAGDRVPADARLLTASKLEADESALT